MGLLGLGHWPCCCSSLGPTLCTHSGFHQHFSLLAPLLPITGLGVGGKGGLMPGRGQAQTTPMGLG